MAGLGWVSESSTSSSALIVLWSEAGCPWSYGDDLVHVKSGRLAEEHVG